MSDKILFLTTADINNPSTGADRRSKNIYEGLNEEFDVELLTYGENIAYPSFEALAPFNLRYFSRLLSIVEEKNYDYIFVSRIGAATYGLIASRLSGAKLIFDDHNVEHQLELSQGNYLRFLYSYLTERRMCKKADLVITTSEKDRKKLQRWIKNESLVVANGYDSEKFNTENWREGEGALFFGNMNYQPNQEALEIISEQIAPELEKEDIKVKIAGPNSKSYEELFEENENVQILGFVEDIAETIKDSKVVIVPLKTGSGTRLKIIESLACGKPVVSTPKGAEGWSNLNNLTITDKDKISDSTAEVLQKNSIKKPKQVEKYSWTSQTQILKDQLRSGKYE